MNSLQAYITCPFDKSHRILEARIQYHLIKCRRNYPKNMKVICPFDATHMLDSQEVEHHLSICPSSGNLRRYEYSFESERQVGTIPVEQACTLETNTINEDWTGNYPSYNPLHETENKNVLRVKIGLSKAKKKEFRQYERDRISILKKDNSHNSNISIRDKTVDIDQPLRAPKNVSKAVLYTENDSVDNVISALESTFISETNNSLEKTNITILNNNSPKKASSQRSSLRNRTINTSNVSLTSENISEQEEKENVCAKENIPIAVNYSTPTAATNDSKVKDEFESNACQESNQKDSVQPNLNKGCCMKSWSTVHLNLETAEKLYGAVRKISTGRGFTMAHQFLNSTLSDITENKDPKNFNALFGYDDD